MITKRLGLVYSILLIVLISLPTLRWLNLGGKPDGNLYGYVDKIPERPEKFARGFFSRTLQLWAGRYFEVHLGFRETLIRSFNELNFRLFREMPRLRLYSTPERGLYSGMSIEFLNYEILQKQELETRYETEASKLLAVQKLLETHGKIFVVIIASSKPYVYPESLGRRYIFGGSENVFTRASRFGAALERAGVNVIDSGPLLRSLVATHNIMTHPNSGVHWNYYAGSIVAQLLMQRVREKFTEAPALSCGDPNYAAPYMTDIDGLCLLNIWSDGGLARKSPYPRIAKSDLNAWLPSFVFIGDSFSDQIRFALQQGRVYASIVNSGYFRSREVDVDGSGYRVTHDVDAELPTTRAKLLQDITASDVVVLEMVDYNVPRWSYDFPDYLLSHFAFASNNSQQK